MCGGLLVLSCRVRAVQPHHAFTAGTLPPSANADDGGPVNLVSLGDATVIARVPHSNCGDASNNQYDEVL